MVLKISCKYQIFSEFFSMYSVIYMRINNIYTYIYIYIFNFFDSSVGTAVVKLQYKYPELRQRVRKMRSR